MLQIQRKIPPYADHSKVSSLVKNQPLLNFRWKRRFLWLTIFRWSLEMMTFSVGDYSFRVHNSCNEDLMHNIGTQTMNRCHLMTIEMTPANPKSPELKLSTFPKWCHRRTSFPIFRSWYCRRSLSIVTSIRSYCRKTGISKTWGIGTHSKGNVSMKCANVERLNPFSILS